MGRVAAILTAALLLFAGAVWYAQGPPPAPLGYSGLQFARLTMAAERRTPGLEQGALVQAVEAGSPADKAGIKPGMIVGAIDGEKLRSAADGVERIARMRSGQIAALTLYDGMGEKPQQVPVTLAETPDPARQQKYSVYPPRLLAKDAYKPMPMAGNAAWTKRIQRGATTKPMKLIGFGTGRCNGLAPDKWKIIGYEKDGSLLQVAMPGRFQQALIATVAADGAPQAVIAAFLQTRFGSPATLSPPRPQPFGFTQVFFGNEKGGTGFVTYRVKAGRLQLWIAAAAAPEADWSLPIAGAVAFSLNCGHADNPRDAAMTVTSVSAQCLGGQCQDSDLAASYLASLKLGYVHDPKGTTWLINPKRDYWMTGEKGPGFYYQLGGENEKLLPGRLNDAPRVR
jgi:hypothetical protein